MGGIMPVVKHFKHHQVRNRKRSISAEDLLMDKKQRIAEDIERAMLLAERLEKEIKKKYQKPWWMRFYFLMRKSFKKWK